MESCARRFTFFCDASLFSLVRGPFAKEKTRAHGAGPQRPNTKGDRGCALKQAERFRTQTHGREYRNALTERSSHAFTPSLPRGFALLGEIHFIAEIRSPGCFSQRHCFRAPETMRVFAMVEIRIVSGALKQWRKGMSSP